MNIPTVGDTQAAYWRGNLSRAEAQNSFDQFASTLMGMQQQLIKLEFVLSFIVQKLGITPEEVQAYADAKAKEFIAAQQAAQGAQPPADQPSVTLN